MFARSSGGLCVPTLAVDTTVIIISTLLMILTLLAIVERIAPTPASPGSTMTRAGLETNVFERENVHISAGPELILAAPLIGLSHQSDGAVDTLEILGQRYRVILSTETRTRLVRNKEARFL